MRIYIDIETIPSQAPDARELARQGVKPPATHKKPETIEKWWAEEGETAVEDAYRKQALDGATGEVCAVAFADEDMEPASLVRQLHESERHFLGRVMDGLLALLEGGSIVGGDGRTWPTEPYFIGHNTGFDLGFLMRRCWVRGIKPPFPFPRPSARDGKDYGDTMTLWAGYRGTISLDRLCRALKLPSPKAEGVDGSKVFDLWKSDDHDTLAKYNAADVEAVRAVWWTLNWEVVA